MTTFITVSHSGVVVTNEIGSYEFVGMKETFLLNEFRTLVNMVHLVREQLGVVKSGLKVKLISGRAMATG
jgi:hypothetical protein